MTDSEAAQQITAQAGVIACQSKLIEDYRERATAWARTEEMLRREIDDLREMLAAANRVDANLNGYLQDARREIDRLRAYDPTESTETHLPPAAIAQAERHPEDDPRHPSGAAISWGIAFLCFWLLVGGAFLAWKLASYPPDPSAAEARGEMEDELP